MPLQLQIFHFSFLYVVSLPNLFWQETRLTSSPDPRNLDFMFTLGGNILGGTCFFHFSTLFGEATGSSIRIPGQQAPSLRVIGRHCQLTQHSIPRAFRMELCPKVSSWRKLGLPTPRARLWALPKLSLLGNLL